MKRHFPGLHGDAAHANEFLEGIFLVRVDRAYYRWHPQKPFFFSASRSWSLRNLPPADFGTSLLHPEVPLETELVPA